MTELYVQRIDNSRLRRKADPRRQRELAILVAIAALAAMLFLGYGWQRFQIVRLNYQTAALRRRETGLRGWNRALLLEQASLRDPMRIYAVSERELGLNSPSPGQVIALAAPAAGSAAPVLAESRRPALRY